MSRVRYAGHMHPRCYVRGEERAPQHARPDPRPASTARIRAAALAIALGLALAFVFAYGPGGALS
jgi:hypothetical protein